MLPTQPTLRGIFFLSMFFCLQACEQAPEFEEGESTTTNGGNGAGGGSTNVAGTGAANASLSWDIPSLRENGDDLSLNEIAGYEIVYRLINEASYTVITVEDNNSSSHDIQNMSAGNYEFMIAVFDSDGLYSDYSDPVYATLSEN